MYSDLPSGYHIDDLGMELDVPFVPTDERVVQAMLELGGVDASDTLFDLGSGDGRIVVAAAREYGAHAVGVEIDSSRVKLSEAYAQQMGVEHKTSFIQEDLFTVDFSNATVVTMYLLHSANLDLRPRLLTELRPGTRIVSHAFDMGDWRPDRRARLRDISLFLWVVPAPVAGTWCWEAPDGRLYCVSLEQKYQRLSGSVWIDGQLGRLSTTLLWGDLLEFGIEAEGDYEAESVVFHWREDHLVAVSEHQKGAIALRTDAWPGVVAESEQASAAEKPV